MCITVFETIHVASLINGLVGGGITVSDILYPMFTIVPTNNTS